jgi:hypothetical protein
MTMTKQERDRLRELCYASSLDKRRRDALLAAAPALLAACKELLEVVPPAETPSEVAFLNRCRAAIAKAEGK